MRFESKKMDQKMIMFEYLQTLIQHLEKNNKKYYNYNSLADKYADQFKISRKGKEILIELLEQFYPPPKRNILEVIKGKKAQGTKAAGKEPVLATTEEVDQAEIIVQE